MSEGVNGAVGGTAQVGRSRRVWRRHAIEDDLGVHSVAWDTLNATWFQNHPLLDSRLWDSLLRHFGHPGVQLWSLEDADGVQAMCLLEPKGWGRWQSYLPAQAQIGPTLIRERAMVDELLLTLQPMALQIDLLCIDPDLVSLDPLPGDTGRLTLHARTMAIDVRGGFDDYWAQRASGLRQNLRRNERLAEAAGVRFEHRWIEDPAAMGDAVRRYAALESRGWKSGEGTALAVGTGQSRFYADLLLLNGISGQAVVHELWQGDRLAASRLMLRGNGNKVMLKTTYDEALNQYAPGWRLLALTLGKVFADRASHKVDFYTDAHQGQLPWATQLRWIRHITRDRPGALGSAWRSLQTLRSCLEARRRARQSPPNLSTHRYRWGEPLPKDVSALMAKAARLSLEISLPWYENLHRTVFSQHPDAALWVLSRDGQAVAALPVLVEPKGWGQQISNLGNYYTAFYAPTLAPNLKPEELAVLVRAIGQQQPRLGTWSFAPMDPLSDEFHCLQSALALAGLVCHRYFRFGNWHLPGQSGYAAYLKGRSGNMRSSLKRGQKAVQAAGGRVEILQTPADLARGLAAYWQVYKSSWKQDEPHPDFIDGLAAWCAQAGHLRLGVLWLGDQAIAAQMWLVSHGQAEIFKVAYDEAHKALSPGTVLTAALLEQVLDRDNVTDVDFLIGDDGYKKVWMSHRRERWGIIAHNPFSLGGLAGLVREKAGRLARRLRQKQAEKPSE